MEVVYLTDITGTIGEWLDSELDGVPQETVSFLEKAYSSAVKVLDKKSDNDEDFRILTKEEIETVKEEELEVVLSPNTNTYHLYSNEIDAYWDSGVSSEEKLEELMKDEIHLTEEWLFGDVEI